MFVDDKTSEHEPDAPQNPVWQQMYTMEQKPVILITQGDISLSLPGNLSELPLEKINIVNSQILAIAQTLGFATSQSKLENPPQLYFKLPNWISQLEYKRVQNYIEEVATIGNFNDIQKSMFSIFAKLKEVEKMTASTVGKSDFDKDQSDKILRGLEEIILNGFLLQLENIGRITNNEIILERVKQANLNTKAQFQNLLRNRSVAYVQYYTIFRNLTTVSTESLFNVCSNSGIFQNIDFKKIEFALKEKYGFIFGDSFGIFSKIAEMYSSFDYPTPEMANDSFNQTNQSYKDPLQIKAEN